jgi:hypothetical protein
LAITAFLRSDPFRLADFVNFARVADWAFDDPKIAYILLDKAEGFQPESWEVPFYRGQFLHRSGQDKSALHHAQKACVAAAWQPECWNLIAEIQRTVGLESEAVKSTERALLVGAKRKRLAADAIRSINLHGSS